MNSGIKVVVAASALMLGVQALSQVTFYEGEGFPGACLQFWSRTAGFQTLRIQ